MSECVSSSISRRRSMRRLTSKKDKVAADTKETLVEDENMAELQMPSDVSFDEDVLKCIKEENDPGKIEEKGKGKEKVSASKKKIKSKLAQFADNKIMIGSQYQAVIPELSVYDDVPPYENKDELLWNPNVLSEEETEFYLHEYKRTNPANDLLPAGNHLHDNEQALYLLHQCGYNIEEALRRKTMNYLPHIRNSVTPWSKKECKAFEEGLLENSKKFSKIQKTKVGTRSVSEIVQFYYLWKKSARSDEFNGKTRLQKKKYAVNPGKIDFMERFLNISLDNNNAAGSSFEYVSE